MALVKETLKTAILLAFMSQMTKTDNPESALDDLSDKLATAIDAYIKSGTVGTVVTGTSVSGGAVTGTGTGQIT